MERTPSDRRKQSLYFPADILDELQAEASRLDRSLSWVVQRACVIGLPQIKLLSSVPHPDSSG